MTRIVVLTPIIALLSYNSSNRLSQASWHIVFCISHTKPDSVSTLFQAFDSFVCNNRCLLISPHASVIPHYRRYKKKSVFFSFHSSNQADVGSFLVFRASLFSFSPLPPAFHPPTPLWSAVSARSRDRRIREGHLI